MFENVTWPIACVYNAKANGGTKSTGKAEVEVIVDPKNKLLKRRDTRQKQPFVDYANEAAKRISTS